jgi:hypothetical protein
LFGGILAIAAIPDEFRRPFFGQRCSGFDARASFMWGVRRK